MFIPKRSPEEEEDRARTLLARRKFLFLGAGAAAAVATRKLMPLGAPVQAASHQKIVVGDWSNHYNENGLGFSPFSAEIVEAQAAQNAIVNASLDLMDFTVFLLGSSDLERELTRKGYKIDRSAVFEVMNLSARQGHAKQRMSPKPSNS